MPAHPRINFQPEAKTWFERASVATQIDATPVLEFLSAGFGIGWFRERGHRLWMALIKPSEKLAEHFALGMEYVVIGHGFPNDFQQRTLLAEPPTDLAYRVDSRIRFVVSAAPLMRATCASWAAKTKIAVIPVDAGGLSTGEALRQIYEMLSSALWRRDVFDDSEPVVDAAEFFGRQQAVQELATKVFLGQPVALFGLRKIGKSSLLERVRALLDADRTHVVATTKLLCNSVRLRRWWVVLTDLIGGWSSAIEARAISEQSAVRPRVGKLDELIRDGKRLGDPAAIADAFEKDFGKLLRAATQLRTDKNLGEVRLVSIFDEVDSLFPHLPNSGAWREEYFLLWNALQAIKRGLDDPAEVTYILGGVNPSGVESGSLLGQANPLFEMSRLYLGPLPLKETRELLRGFGSRVGFLFDDDAVGRCFEITGGHPWLLRKLGSKLHRNNIDRADRMLVTGGMVTRIFGRTKREFYAHVDWILNHLRNVAPDEFRLLKDIALGGHDKYLDEWSDEGFRDTFADHLFQYGLVTFVNDEPTLALTLVRDALTVPASSGLSEQKKQLREAIDLFEGSVRIRLKTDLTAEGQGQAVTAIVDAIPKEAANRALSREQLRELGTEGGIQALLDNLNWGDYLLLLDKYYDTIRWSGGAIGRGERMTKLRAVVQFMHLVRHNNDTELRRQLDEIGFPTLYGSLMTVHEMVAG